MTDRTSGRTHGSAASPDDTGTREPMVERLDEAQCLRLIEAGGIGRLAYSGRYGLTVIPVNYKMFEGTVVFRTTQGGSTDEDLRTGIADAEYSVAFEIDDLDPAVREGWSVLIHGSAHHVDTEEERAAVSQAGVDPWPGGQRELFFRITPTRITGRSLRQKG